MEKTISASIFADLMGVSKSTLKKWELVGRVTPHHDENAVEFFYVNELMHFPKVREMANSKWEEENAVTPLGDHTSIELFAGAGGLALGMQKAGFRHVMLNEIDHTACQTLRVNMPQWNVVEGDIHEIDFSPYRDKVDLLTGGFPCQAFSYAGNKAGFGDTRGTLFFELARAVSEIRPRVFLCENVKGLVSHDGGKTLDTIKDTIARLGYDLVEPRVLHAIEYRVPQKRERLFLVAVRNDIAGKAKFQWPSPYGRVMTLRDAFLAGELYPTDVPASDGQRYPEKKRKVMELVPMGGYWRDLPEETQKEYMGASYHLGGGKTGMARRLSMDEPSLTLTCAPAQKQTERCHPYETRPLTVREYARIQTFPDDWVFQGNLAAQYKQIGNAVPVNLALAVGKSLVRMLNEIEETKKQGSQNEI